MFENIVLLLLAAFPLMGSPGPATLSLAAAGSVFGVGRSLPYLAGIILGTTGVLLIIASGVTGLLFALPGVLPVLSTAALCYILYLAYRIATAPIIAGDAEDKPAPSLAGGFLLAIANPKAFTAIGAVYASITVVADAPLADATAKLVALFGVLVTVNTSWLWLGGVLAGLLRNPRTGRAMNVLLALMLVVSVGVAAML